MEKMYMSKISSNLLLEQPVQIFEQFIDKRDCQSYRFAKIGTQTWMVDNLAFEITPGSKIYRDDTANLTKYGRLYDFETAKKACPSGWHLPSMDEWSVLINLFDSPNNEDLKAKSSNGIDTLGFAALLGGRSDSNGKFCDVGKGGYWWSSDESKCFGYIRGMFYDTNDLYWELGDKSNFYSVRCVQD